MPSNPVTVTGLKQEPFLLSIRPVDKAGLVTPDHAWTGFR